MEKDYDLIIVGGGSAGLTAAIYAGRSELKTLVIEQGAYGGRIKDTSDLMNYPGVPNVSGSQLMDSFKGHAELFESVDWLRTTVKEIELLDNGDKLVKTGRRGDFSARALIMATGTRPRILGIEGEEEFVGKGVAYCATCDAKFFQDQEVFVLGAGNQAIEEAQFIARFAKKVTIVVIHPEGKLDCDKVAAQQAYKNPKIDFIWNSTLEAIKGEASVEAVVVKNIKTDELTQYPASGVFFFVGMIPQTESLEGLVEMDRGFVLVNEEMESSQEGLYVAGDCRVSYLRQVITAASDGAVAAVAAERYINNKAYLDSLMEEVDKKLAFIFYNPYDEFSFEGSRSLSKQLEDEALVILQDISKNTRLYKKLGFKGDLSLAIYINDKFIEKEDFQSMEEVTSFIKK